MGGDARADFAALMNEARVRKHLSLSEAARLVGVPKATAHGWFTGSHFPTPALRPNYLQLIELLGLTHQMPAGLWAGASDMIGPSRDAVNPYLGLRPFSTHDRELFYGRTAQTRAVADAVAARGGRGIVALIGPSGSGKSSLLRAGVIARECVDGRLEGLSCVELSHSELVTDDIAAAPPCDLSIIDQFEDLFLLPDADLERAIDNVGIRAANGIVVIALRSDAFAAASRYPILRDALSRPVLITPLTRAELREVIEGPAALLGVGVQPELISVLEAELAPGSSPTVALDVLPLLSTALMATWAYGRDAWMSVADYLATGGVGSAVERQAEALFGQLPADAQRRAEALFLRLVRLGQHGISRESVSLSQLGEADLDTLQGFIDDRLLTMGRDALWISHDALLTHWQRLDGWIRLRAEDLAVRDRVRAATRLWLEADRSSDLLLPPARLGLNRSIEEPVDDSLFGTAEREYLQASEQHFADLLAQERTVSSLLRRRGRISLGLAAVATALALVVGLFYVRAEDFRGDAVAAQLSAQSRQVAMAATSLRSQDANLQGQLALEARDLSDTLEARSALLELSGQDVPTRWLGSPSAVLGVSPSGDLLARADGSGTVTLWRADQLRAEAGRTVEVAPHGTPLYAVALAHVGGRDLLAVGGASTATLWDVTDGTRLVQDLRPGTLTAYAVAFSRDGRFLAVGYSDGHVDLHPVGATGTTAQPAQVQVNSAGSANPEAISSLAFDNQSVLWAGGRSDAIKRWQLTANGALQPLADVAFHYGPSPLRALTIAVSADGTEVAAGVTANAVLRWNRTSSGLRQRHPITGFGSWVNSVSFARNDTALVVGSSDQTLRLFDLDGNELRSVAGPSVVTGGDLVGDLLVSVSSDGDLRVWGAKPANIRSGGAAVYNLASERDGRRWLAGGTLAQGAMLWRFDNGAFLPVALPYPTLKGARSAAVAIAPDGRFLVAASKAGELISWPLTDTGPGRPRVVETGIGYLSTVTISGDSSLVAAAGYGGKKAVILKADGSGALTVASTVPAVDAQMAAFTADSDVLAIALASNSVELWTGVDTEAPAKASAITGFDTATIAVSAAPKSRMIAVGEDSGHVSVWSITDPTQPSRIADFSDAHGSSYALAFSPDERTLAMAGGDDRLWGWSLDAAAPGARFVIDGHLDRPWDVRYLDGGQLLVAAGNNGRIHTWPSDLAAAAAELCATRGDGLTEQEWRQYLPGIAHTEPCH